ncbi:MAG: T9SS type A sorting domain-containing protein [Bacteroidia bacterium]
MIKKLLSIALVTATLTGNAQQLTNSGFETWAGSPSTPTGWGTIDKAIANSPLGSFIGATSFVTKSSSPHAGSFAMMLSTSSAGTFGTFPAAAVYGDLELVGTTPAFTGTPYTLSPSSVSYYAKGTVIAGDSAPSILFLTKWNTTTNKRDTIAGGVDYLNSSLTSTYTLRTFPIYYQIYGVTPDTINYIISSSVVTSSPALGTSITVDDITISGNVAGITKNASTQANAVAYPNPATSQITIATTSDKAKFVNVYDLTGRLMSKIDMTNKQANIDLNSFNSGMYIYTIVDANNAVLTTSKFNVSK